MITSNTKKSKSVQLQLGQAVVRAIQEFASSEIDSIEELESNVFTHVRDSALRRQLAETLFGARWLYKLGLVTLATNERRAAHIRAQLVDYSAICEGVLLDAVAHGVAGSHLTGNEWRRNRGDIFQWPTALHEIRTEIRKRRSLSWLIRVAKEEPVVGPGCSDDLDWLRNKRNKVHIAEMVAVNEKAYLRDSQRAYKIMHECVTGVGTWMSIRR